MKYNQLGKSGLQISALSLGSWITFGSQIENDIAEKLMNIAYESGINFFDNAEIYAYGNSEIVMGKILKKKNWDRSTYLVSSKVFFGHTENPKPNQEGLSRKHIVEACHAALKRLQVDYLDLFFCHRPDPKTPIEETVRAMSNLIQQGKILYWGTSEWSAQEIMESYWIARKYHLVPPTMEQPQYNMFHRERVEKEYKKLYTKIGLGTTIWSPLAFGLLTGKYNAGNLNKRTRLNLNIRESGFLKDNLSGDIAKERILKVRKLEEIAKKVNIPMSCLAIAWCMKNPYVSTVILGASSILQIKENLKALKVLPKLRNDVVQQIENILQNKPKSVAI